ncbi:MAG: 6,7-dimethyl-8-ribityllumazine synthase [Deltaproteobacteria bacterium]|jgi:6,7-dimethyl-8-ribityllumazine synthase|nr:6,7-dimethyl-8-ribityllumazine synthase [Deltaproteobacteria bacterium]
MSLKVIEGQITAQGLTAVITVSRFNSFITDRLLEGAKDAFIRHGGDLTKLTVIKVPGSFELPLATQAALKTGAYDVAVALGAVIRGQTPHFDYVAAEVTKGLALVGLNFGQPVSFGVLTCDTIEQAVDRAGVKGGNKGFEAMVSAMEMAGLLKLINGASGS